MALIAAHLEQITFSTQEIDKLWFPPPKIFTNAILSRAHDITTLIRDTEAHERALFSVPPPQPVGMPPNLDLPRVSARRQTIFNVAQGEVIAAPPLTTSASSRVSARHNTAVSAVLGGDLHSHILRGSSNIQPTGAGTGDVDVEVLLRGAEKLCAVYALSGVPERILALRQRFAQLSDTMAYYEARVAEQQHRLERMNAERRMDEEDHDERAEEDDLVDENAFTEDDLKRNEEEVKGLEKKKKELQERLRGVEQDLAYLSTT